MCCSQLCDADINSLEIYLHALAIHRLHRQNRLEFQNLNDFDTSPNHLKTYKVICLENFLVTFQYIARNTELESDERLSD